MQVSFFKLLLLLTHQLLSDSVKTLTFLSMDEGSVQNLKVLSSDPSSSSSSVLSPMLAEGQTVSLPSSSFHCVPLLLSLLRLYLLHPWSVHPWIPVLWSQDEFSGFVCMEQLHGAGGGSCCCCRMVMGCHWLNWEALMTPPPTEGVPLPEKFRTAAP